MGMTIKPKCVLKMHALLGESPVWCSKEKVLYWVDIYRGLIHSFDPKTSKNSSIEMNQFVSALGLQKDGNLIVSLSNSIALLDLATKKLTEIYTLERQYAGNRFNDGKCDRRGRFWSATTNFARPHENTACLFQIDAKHHVHLMEDHVVSGNGMGWDPTNRLFYFTQTLLHTIFVYQFDVESGSISNKKVFAKIDPKMGFPDGLTIDSEGFIWIALYGTGRIVRYNPNGEIDRTIELPVPLVTSCAFGGEQLDTLYITTAQEWMNDQHIEKYPLSGSLFAVEAGVKGIEESYYQG